MKLTAVLSLKDNYTDMLKRATKQTVLFRNEVNKTKKVLDTTFGKKLKLNVDTGKAQASLAKIKQPLANMKNFNIKINFRMSNLGSLGKQQKALTDSAKKLTQAPFKIAFKLVDLATGPLNLLKDTITSSLKGAASLEQTSMVVEHSIGVNNKGMSADKVKQQAEQYMKDFRTQPELAAFDTKDVQEAGTKAIAITSGDSKEATNLLRMSADMAALTPGKSINDALEALSALRNGEADGMKDFNFEVNKSSLNSAGHDLSKIKNDKGIALQDMYKGGGEKKGQTADGLMTSVKGSLMNGIADMGKETLEILKPQIQGLSNYLKSDGARKMFSGGSKMLASLTRVVVGSVQTMVKFFQSDGVRKMFSGGLKMIGGLTRAVVGRVQMIQNWVSSKFLNNVEFQNQPGFIAKFGAVLGEVKKSFEGWYEKDGRSMISGFFSGLISNGVLLLAQAIPLFTTVAIDLGIALGEGLFSGLKKLGSLGVSWFKDRLGFGDKDNEKEGKVTDPPKKAIGITRVPYDNYPALLHQNERVLTAQEARSTDSRTPVTINLVAGKQVDPDMNKLMAVLKTAVETAGFNMAPGGATA